MRIVGRLERLEKVVAIRMPKPTPTLVYVRDPNLTDREQQTAAMARYKAEHPGWHGDDFNFICAISEECKALVERLMSGERTEREAPWLATPEEQTL